MPRRLTLQNDDTQPHALPPSLDPPEGTMSAIARDTRRTGIVGTGMIAINDMRGTRIDDVSVIMSGGMNARFRRIGGLGMTGLNEADVNASSTL